MAYAAPNDSDVAIAANYCDLFRHSSEELFLFTNSGEMRAHLARLGWKLIAWHRPMPLFPRRDIDEQGFALCRSTRQECERAERFYGEVH